MLQDLCRGRLGVRHIQAVILFFGLTIAFAMRVNLSVGIVAMTDNSTNSAIQTLDWNSLERGTLLGSIFWGYVVTQIPAGVISERIGASRPLGVTMIMNGITTLLLPPVAIYWGFLPACFMRVIHGLSQGFIYPSCTALLSKWDVPDEQGRVFSLVFGGAQFGTIIMLGGGGLLAESPGGWPSIFYVSGSMGVLWGILCLCYIADSPGKHKTITEVERAYIDSFNNNSDASKKLKPPWLSMIRSVPFWALMVVSIAQNWGFWTLLTLIPSYINGVLHFNIANNGFLSALPYLTMWLASFIFSAIADYLIQKKYLSRSSSRKLWNSVALYGCALALTLLSFVKTDATIAIALLTVALGLNAAAYSGYYLNYLDLSPNFAGIIMGISNFAANIGSIISPTIAGVIITEKGNVAQWRIVFLITAVILLIGQTIFNIFASGEVQGWNSNPKKQEDH